MCAWEANGPCARRSPHGYCAEPYPRQAIVLVASAPLVPGRSNDLNSTSKLELIVSYPDEEDRAKLVNHKKSNLKYTVDAPHPLVRVRKGKAEGSHLLPLPGARDQNQRLKEGCLLEDKLTQPPRSEGLAKRP
jgi:hypothetical protein